MILTFAIWIFIGAAWCIIFVSALVAAGLVYLMNDLLKRISVIKTAYPRGLLW